MTSFLRSGLSVLLLGSGFLTSDALAAQAMSKAQVRGAISAYARARGIRPAELKIEIVGTSRSGKSTLATVKSAGGAAKIFVGKDGQVRSSETATMIDVLLDAHTPMKRAGLGTRSTFATEMVSFRLGAGAGPLARMAPVGRPRAGQGQNAEALDALSLGDRGSVTVALARPVISGRRGAAIKVRENGFGNAAGDIVNQTPGLVEVKAGGAWYRLGYAGYKVGGDSLLLRNAIDPIPTGRQISQVRVSDAPGAPHPMGFDPTDNAVAQARGVKGFDLVSVEGLAGSGK
jgi:hypothetical protein